MPTLPAPPPVPSSDRGWLAQTLPVVASLASIGVLTATTGHAMVALVMIGATIGATAFHLDHQWQQRRREIGRLRREYDAALAGVAPSPDWTPPRWETGADPVCRLLAARHLRRLGAAAAVTAAPRDPRPAWGRGSVGTIPGGRAGASVLAAQLAPTVRLDLREAAAGGMGPHGVIVGATGSGKSELLRALVLSLALQQPPEEVTFVLIDFKGGTALGDLAALPHCAGLITNLATDDRLVPRMIRALDAELDRRQSLVRDGGAVVPLVVVIDEFSELLTAHPEVLDLLVRVRELGRALGMHLVLASQRLEEARLRELDAHLSWRLALRTNTTTESLAVLGIPDAAHLPREPGWALLNTGPEDPVRFRVTPADDAFAQRALGNLTGSAPDARPIWLPPLRDSPRLEELLAGGIPNSSVTKAGFGGAGGGTRVPFGVIDDPVERRLAAIDADHGHVAIIGRPGSGKSTLLATLEAALRFVRPNLEVHRVDAHAPEAALAWMGLPHGPATPDRRVASAPPIVLLVDDWSVLRQEHPLVEDALVRVAIAQPGLRILLTAHRWADVRPALRDLLETRIELRLADPLDSLLDRRLAAAVPIRQPGWGLIEDEHFVAAVSSTAP